MMRIAGAAILWVAIPVLVTGMLHYQAVNPIDLWRARLLGFLISTGVAMAIVGERRA